MRMPSVDEFINELMHFTDYDPEARHLAYLRTRQLKGRKPAAAAPVKVPNRNTGVVGPAKKPAPKKPAPKKPVPKPAPKPTDSAATRAANQAKVDALKARLEKLRTVLKDLVDKAQVRAGLPTDAEQASKKTAATKAAPAKKPAKELTAKQKADARKRSAEWYAKNKTKKVSEVTKDLQSQIDDVNAKIKAMRAKLGIKASSIPKKKPVPVGAGKK
jgi:hypothetical protein